MGTQPPTPSTDREVRHQLWRRGSLDYKLDEGRPSGPQRDIYNASLACDSKTFVTEASRRLGKTTVHAIIAVELALKNPGRRINWCQDSAKAVRDMAVPLFKKVCADAPDDCKGEFLDARGVFEFPNGAYIFLFGGDSQEDVDRARGGDDPIANFCDEGGFMSLLRYVYESILKPAMFRVKRSGHFGMTFIFSSTPEEITHYFIAIADVNMTKGSYARKTIRERPDFERIVAEEAADAGMTPEEYKQTTTFRREFLCERVVDETKVIFPEFFRHQDAIVRDWPRPIGFERYVRKRVAVDPGMQDKTGILYGYVDFLAGKIVIEAEDLMERPNTKDIAVRVRQREAELEWGEPVERVSRVIDDPHGRMVLDLWSFDVLTRVSFEQAIKHDRATSIGLVRTLLNTGNLIILPSVVGLRAQLMTAVTNKSGKDFARTAEGHYDLCAALLYFCRGLSLVANPYPSSLDLVTGEAMPAEHPIMVRRKMMGIEPGGALKSALSRGRFVSTRRR